MLSRRVGHSRRALRIPLALFLVGSVMAAGCISRVDDESRSTVVSGRVDDATPSTVETDGSGDQGSDDGPTPLVAPDPEGLPSLTEGDPETIDRTLDNGLRYIIRQNDNPGGKVELRLVIDAGSVLEDDSQIGGAHFLEHMLFNGTEKYPKNELIDVLRSFGASFAADVNAYTTFDETVYTLTVPTGDPASVTAGLDVLDQWLSSATIATDDVFSERGIVLDEWRVRNQSASGRLADEAIDFLLGGTSYAERVPIGSRAAIESMDAEPLRRFYDDWYRPDNAAVVVVGDIDTKVIEDQIIELFAEEAPRTEAPSDPEVVVTPVTEPVARVASDPDLPEGYAFVTLPVVPQSGRSPEADAQLELTRRLAFEIIATRLNNDALRGEAPYDSAEVSSSGYVRDLVAPEIYVTVDGPDVEDAVRAVVDEYERVRRFGFTQSEVERAAAAFVTDAERSFDGRRSRQDRSYADEYVDHVLTGDPYVTADREFEFITEVMSRATPANVAHVFVEHLAASGLHVFVAVPADEAGTVPSESALVEIAQTSRERDLEPRGAEVAIGDELIQRPEPVEEVSVEQLADEPFPDFIDPVVVTFPNGVRVAFNRSGIVEGQVFVEGRSPGGLAVLPDADVPAGDALRAVVADSGVGPFDRVALDEFLDDKDVSLVPFVDSFEDRISGQAASSDLEVLFQIIHLTMSDPQVDSVALDQYLDDQLPYAENPGLSPGFAEFAALQDARYDDVRFLAPTPETLALVDVESVARVAADRFGDAGDWTFAFSGDFAISDGLELARSYLATLPATDRSEDPGFSEEPPPAEPVVVETEAGEGETASVSFLITSSASTDRRDDVLARVVQQIVGNRLTDFIREELGDSYSPFGMLELGPGSDPKTELYIRVSTGPDLVDEVSDAVLGQLADLRDAGPTQREFDNAMATVGEELNFFSNGQINDEVLDALVDPEGSPDFDDFLYESEQLSTIASDDVRDAIARWVPGDRYIEVRVLPRS